MIGGIGSLDSSISPAQMHQKMFEKMDSDGSGDVSAEEMKAMFAERGDNEEMVNKIFEELDTDGNGVITSEEHTAGLEKMKEKKPPPPPPPMEMLKKGDTEGVESLPSEMQSLLEILKEKDGNYQFTDEEQSEIESLVNQMEQYKGVLQDYSV